MNFLKKLKNFSVKSILLCVFFRLFYLILKLIYKFDKWHVNGSYYCKPYKKQIIRIINNLKFNSVLEIGCGLGDIINRVKVCQNKFACDIDPHVIKVAKFLTPKQIENSPKFFLDSFYTLKLKNIDTIIMINFMHNINKKDLLFNLKKIIRYSKCKYIIVDGIKKKFKKKYQFCYSQKFWENFGDIYSKHKSVDNVRDFYVIKIKNQ